MNNTNYFKDLFESIPDYRKIVFLLFVIKNDKDLLREVGFSERDINRLNLEFKNILIDQHEKYLDYIKNEEEGIIERFLNKQMEGYFATIFENVRHERSLILLLSLTDPDILKQSKFTDDEINIIKNLALEKLYRQRILKEYHAVSLLE